MIIDIDGVKKTNPGKDAARGTAEIPEENIPDTAPDGRRNYGNELAEIMANIGEEKVFASLIGHSKREELEKAFQIIKDGLIFYDNLVIPRIRRTPEELGFLAFAVERLHVMLADGLKQDETATAFKRMIDGMYKSRFRSETILRRIDKEKKGGGNNL